MPRIPSDFTTGFENDNGRSAHPCSGSGRVSRQSIGKNSGCLVVIAIKQQSLQKLNHQTFHLHCRFRLEVVVPYTGKLSTYRVLSVQFVKTMESYCNRPLLIWAVKDRNVEKTNLHPDSLIKSDPDTDSLMITDKEGTVWAAYPERPELMGKNLAYREWYKGVCEISVLHQTAARRRRRGQ
jgi:hypothetical protein